MKLLGGTSFFGMRTGSRGRHKARRNFESPSNDRPEEIPEPGVSACESAPGTLKRRTMQPSGEARQKFSRMFRVNTTGSPRLGSIKKFTK